MIKKNVLIITVLIAICIEGCENKLAEETIVSDLIGKWKLTYSKDKSDSVYIGNSILELKQDNYFNCNNSFFWRKDTLRYLPLTGKWSVSIYEAPSGGRQSFISRTILLEVDSKRSWALSYDTIQMSWFDTAQVQYIWYLQK